MRSRPSVSQATQNSNGVSSQVSVMRRRRSPAERAGVRGEQFFVDAAQVVGRLVLVLVVLAAAARTGSAHATHPGHARAARGCAGTRARSRACALLLTGGAGDCRAGGARAGSSSSARSRACSAAGAESARGCAGRGRARGGA